MDPRAVIGRRAFLAGLASIACARKAPPPRAVVIPREPEREPEPAYAVPTGRELAGELDTTFGSSGVATFEKATGEQRFDALTMLPDGSFVGAGYAPFAEGHDIFAARVRPNGTLDETFGERGFARVGERRGFGQAVTHDAKGRILVAGDVSAKQGESDALIGRLDARGQLDATFGTKGIVVHDGWKADQPKAMFVRGDGRILVLGRFSSSEHSVLCLLPDGAVDSGFGKNGLVVFGDRRNGYVTRGALTPDGAIVAGGYLPHEKRGFVGRVEASGRVDPAFGPSGVVFVEDPPMSSAWAVAADRKGRILLSGSTQSGAALVRFLPDGSVDRSFGENGVAWADRSGDDQFYALLFDSADNIVGVGFRGLASESVPLVARFRSNGRLDTKFGKGGIALYPIQGVGAFLYAATWDREGGLVAAGDVWKENPSPARSRALLMRFR